MTESDYAFDDIKEPSGATPASPPVLEPRTALHLFAGGRPLPAHFEEGGMTIGCGYSLGIEMLAKELAVPMVGPTATTITFTTPLKLAPPRATPSHRKRPPPPLHNTAPTRAALRRAMARKRLSGSY